MPISKSAQVVIRTWYNFESAHAVCRMRSRWIIVSTYTRIRPHGCAHKPHGYRDILEWRARTIGARHGREMIGAPTSPRR